MPDINFQNISDVNGIMSWSSIAISKREEKFSTQAIKKPSDEMEARPQGQYFNDPHTSGQDPKKKKKKCSNKKKNRIK